MKTKTIYISNDGKEFEDENKCKEYDKAATPNKIVFKAYLHCNKWEVYQNLVDEGYEFDESIHKTLKYILNEVEVTIEIDSTTGEYKIISFN